MKLTVRMIDTPRGRVPMLCNEVGEPLPMQQSIEIKVGDPDTLATVTVVFGVDKDNVTFS